jgi:hypothetical protein
VVRATEPFIRQAYLEAASTAADLLSAPAVVRGWSQPSALEKMSVGGLATHLGQQVVNVSVALAQGVPDEAAIGLLDHYARVAWLGADLDSEANSAIRAGSEDQAAAGADVLVTQVREELGHLRSRLAAESSDRVVRLPWTGWSLSLDDLLVTRMMEIAVHADDLAVSVGVDPPWLPDAVLDPVLNLLTRLSARRYGPTAVLRALSRAERAPTSISAF